ncbi:MAG: NAD(P)H-hydrate dehydratase [Actinomycetota bacterium]
MKPLLSPSEMAAADEATIASGISGFTLMDRAGRAVARAAIGLAGRRYGARVAVVCGKGNNGGDGFAAARVLHRHGVAVRCLLLSDAPEYRGDAAAHLQAMAHAGVTPEPFDAGRLRDRDVVVDAIFGTGFRGPAQGRPAEAIGAINGGDARVLAVDIPSGVAGETGAVEGPAVSAEVTIALAAQKLGTVMPPGSVHAGRVEVADIGIETGEASVLLPEAADIAALLPVRATDAHKRSSGSVLVLAGSDGMSGAALLTVRGAARMEAGYVTLVSTSYVDHAKRSTIPEAVSRIVAGHSELGPEVLDDFAPDFERADAVAVGPGLGRGERQRALLEAVLAQVDAPLVLDADALNVLSEDRAALSKRERPTVITPHPGEMGALMRRAGGEVQSDRLAVARRAARELGCIVVLKGAGSIVTGPEGPAVVNPTGGPELATAGTGDVLTGVVAALLAERLDASDAAVAGVFVHGLAGTAAGRSSGGRGVVAWDVAEALPIAVGELFESATVATRRITLSR